MVDLSFLEADCVEYPRAESKILAEEAQGIGLRGAFSF
jgi:hypothetical protein